MTGTAIVYYSRTGTSRQVAQAVAARTGWPLAEVADAKSRAGLLGDLRCVADNLLRRHAAYRYNGPPLSGCGHIIIIAPVWMGRLAAPMRSFLADSIPAPPLGARVSAICVMASRGGFQALAEVSRLTGKSPVPSLVLLERDVLGGETAADIGQFVQAMTEKDAGASMFAERPAWLSPNQS